MKAKELIVNKVTTYEVDFKYFLLSLTNCLFKQDFKVADDAMYFLIEKAQERRREKEKQTK